MSREVKRVALDFDWPIGEVWKGYLSPESLDEVECVPCEGSGYSPTARWLNSTFYGGSRYDHTGWGDKVTQAEVDLLVEKGRIRPQRGEPTTAEEVNARQVHGPLVGHDAINRGIMVEWRCERLGVSDRCEHCQGHGSNERYPGQRAEAEAWQRTEPPEGEGWQFWETVSEGSPQSPVFATKDELVDWLVETGCWNQKYSREAAEAVCETGFSLGSFITVDGEVIDGVEALVRKP